MNIKVLVAAHKKAKMPTDKKLYLPVHVGAVLHPNLKLGYQPDSEGINISSKNGSYNELTAIYWAWKNLSADAVGLVHYRRLLSLKRTKDFSKVLSEQEAQELLATTGIILPKKRHYYIETNYSHYVHAHHAMPLNECRRVISDIYPAYLPSFDKIMKQTSAHMFNIFIMKWSYFDEYCQWMFRILEELDTRIDTSSYDEYESRVIGFVSELLLDVWLDKKGYAYEEINCSFMEKQNWLKKGGSFVLRKLMGSRE
ncbi:exopolysaccharide biosynthesis protein [Levilactobacillus brevis]|uniref:DUF4422 domain-containing protein n=1 Tax=Levilactobacillus brevis TaxID=1580 RepID=UPI0007F91E92|nr:DUF4422 domain-containing protein [Levilactobacillus brevis]ANN49531.1 exopolysaccharide biosynthesis protein [Levilactobacillus brevis]